MQPDDGTVTEADLESSIAKYREMIAELDRDIDHRPEVITRPDSTYRVKVIAALVNEAFGAAVATSLLVEHRLPRDACTAARRAFEHALNASWLASDRGSVDAFELKGTRWSKKMAGSLRKAGMDVELDPDVLNQIGVDLPKETAAENEISQVILLCGVFNDRLYVPYRLLCQSAHPSASTVTKHYQQIEDPSEKRTTLTELFLAAHTAAASAVWAGRALDKFDIGQKRKPILKKAARNLRVSPVLYPEMPHEGRWPI